MPDLQKNAVNPHFGNSYISLESLMEQIIPVLHTYDLVLIQSPTSIGEKPALTTTLIHAPSGESISDSMFLVLDRDNPQGQGSAITYARRYSLMSILGLVADEDDDGNDASKAAPQGVSSGKEGSW